MGIHLRVVQQSPFPLEPPITLEERTLICHVVQGELRCLDGHQLAVENEWCMGVLTWLVREARKGVGNSEWNSNNQYVDNLIQRGGL